MPGITQIRNRPTFTGRPSPAASSPRLNCTPALGVAGGAGVRGEAPFLAERNVQVVGKNCYRIRLSQTLSLNLLQAFVPPLAMSVSVHLMTVANLFMIVFVDQDDPQRHMVENGRSVLGRRRPV